MLPNHLRTGPARRHPPPAGPIRHPARARWRRVLLALAFLLCAGGLTLRLWGDALVPPLVDAVRGVIGPAAMASIEAQYYGLVETTRQWQHDLGLAPPPAAPWAVALPPGPPASTAGDGRDPAPADPPAPDAGPLPGDAALPPGPSRSAATRGSEAAAPASGPPPAAPARPAPAGLTRSAAGQPPALAPLVSSALPGEGVWTTADLPTTPGNPGAPVFWKTFLRPDAARRAAFVYLVRFDPRRVQLHLVAGTQEPVSPTGAQGAGQVATPDRGRLVAAFNGGWKSINGHYGMRVDGRQIAPPNPAGDTATLAVHADGRIELAAWQTLSTAADLVSYRQNCPLLIDQGRVVVQDHLASTWGLSILSQMYVWRSALGQTADGTLIFAAGTPVSATELATALQRAGAVTAMQLDINSAWVHWLTYGRDARGTLRATPLVPGMAYRRDQYLTAGARDFFYLTWP